MNEAIITHNFLISQTDVNIPGYVLYGFEEIAQWHAESNSSISVMMMMIMVKMIMIMVKMIMMVTMVLMISIMMMMALITMVAEYEYFDTLYDFNYGAKKKRTVITNMMIQVNMKRWKSSGSIYFVFAQYRYNSNS